MSSRRQAPPGTALLRWSYSALSACLAAGYGALFSVTGEYREQYGIGETAIGAVIGIGFIAGFAAQVLVAPLADRGRARMVVLVSVIVNGVGLAMMGLATDTVTLTVGRVVSGLAIGSATPAIRRIIVVADPANIGQNLGRLLSADVFGFALGPALSAVLVSRYGLAAPFLVIAVVSAVAVAASLPVRVAEVGDAPRQRLALDLLADRSFAGAIVLGATVYLMIGAFDALWDVVHVDLETTSWLADLGITLFAVPLVVLGPTGGRLAQSLGPFPVAAGGLLVAAGFIAAYGLVPSGGWIFGLAMAHAVTDGLTIAASGVAVGMTAPAHRQAGGQGVLGAAQALMAGIMAPVTGWLYQVQGRPLAYGAAAAAMVVLVAVGLSLAGDVGRTRRVV